jgi:hypothetical protein
MNKLLLVLDGKAEGKNIFLDTIKTAGWWTWNINFLDFLSSIARRLFWDGEKSMEHHNFISELRKLSNGFFDSENLYLDSTINRFENNQNVQILIVHNTSQEIAKELQEKYINCFSVFITDVDKENESYTQTLNYRNPDYTTRILDMINIMTKDFSSTKETN